MEALQWHSFEKKIYIKAKIEKIYSLWASETGITAWFLESAKFKDMQGKPRKAKDLVMAGDRYIWSWHNWDGKAEGEIIKANGSDYIEFSFENSKVSVHLEQKDKLVIISLKQFEIPEDEEHKMKLHYGCSNGWTFWLTNLKAYLEHGILLNETEVDLKENALAGYQFVNM